jgi:prepilin-type N-terminal cleavage/methylation domain-containing protein
MIARHRKAGFSLVELLIVMAISLVLLGMVVPAMRTRDSASAEVRRVVADAARARSWARTTWRTTTLDVDTANRRWRIVDDTGEVLDTSSADENGWRTLATGVDFAAMQGSVTDLVFESDGRGSTDATVQILAGSSTWTVSLSALTGTVTADSES